MKAKLLIVCIVVLSCVAAPLAGATQYAGPGAGGPVLIPNEEAGQEFVGGPGAAGPVLPSDVLGFQPAGGPGAAGPVLATTGASANDGFDWASAALGCVFAIGLVLIATGLTVRWRRHGGRAQPQH